MTERIANEARSRSRRRSPNRHPNRPTIGSLFCGAGGFDLGFINAGFEVAWAIDNDPDACETYRRNVGKHVRCEDAIKVAYGQLPNVDVVIGGFPCQGFSLANTRRAPDDRRNSLYREFVRCVEETKPPMFVAENVRGLLSLAGGAVMAQIQKDFEGAGYRLSWRVLNAASFGVPQNRIRVIIVGRRADLNLELDWPDPDCPKRRPFATLGDALRSLPEPTDPHSLPNHVGSKYKATARNFTGHRATRADRPAPTVLARGDGGGGVCAINHPNGKRRLTVREQAALQCFPPNFEFSGTMSSAYRQVGNAVPVGLAEVIARMVQKSLCDHRRAEGGAPINDKRRSP